MLRKEPWPGPNWWPLVLPRTILGETFVTRSLSRLKVFVTANPHPASKERRIMSAEVAGVAEARPKGFMNFNPAKSTEISTRSIGLKKFGREGCFGIGIP